uniref:BPI2 domain-containing protein n=1 Tax=Trichuris muris TaxID=70415 RepID=A0A5S6QIN7_TRIMR
MRSVTFAVHASNVAYDIGFTLSGRQNGELMVAVGSCDINVQRVRVTTEELHGSRLVWNFVKSLLRSSLRHFINRKLCKLLRNHVTEEVKSHLKITGKQKLLHGDFHNIGITETIGGYRHGNSSYNAIFMQKLDKAFHQLYMNTGLVESPSTDRKGSTVFINIPVNGEIYAPGYRNNVGRNVMSEIDMHRNKMLYIGINEFVINTLLSSLYHMDAMNFTLNSVNTPKLEDFLQTDCEDFCLGTFLPEVADAHPGRAFSLLMVADRAPAASFDVQGIQIKLTAVITVQVDAPGSKIPVMRADVRMRATVSLRVRNQKLHGTAEVNEFDLKPREKLNLGKDAVELMNEVPGKVIEAELNNILDKGIQLPTLDLFSLRNVAITHVLKGIWMELDFNFNFDAVAKLIKNILKHPNSHY